MLDRLRLQTKSRFINDIFRDAVNSVRRNSTDSAINNSVLLEKSAERFEPYEGKIIRYIHVRQFGFDKLFSDTSTRITYLGTKILNALHTTTKEFVIRQNLFVEKGEKVSAFELADNERYLRTLDYIQDARILVMPLPDDDSVDLLVITKDLFSLTGAVGISGLKRAEVTIADANLAGMAQRGEVTGLWDQSRTPRFAYEVLYRKSNIGGSFINGTILYTKLNNDRSDGPEEESAFLLQLDLPLVSTFSRFAGGAMLNFGQSLNVYEKSVTDFYQYRYMLYDGWLGYNIGVSNKTSFRDYNASRNHFFLSARYLHKDFQQEPFQIRGNFDPIYNDREMAIGQLTLYKQDFYKLNYITGFGTTEDVPMGYSISLTGGWYRQRWLERTYGGVQLEHYLVTPQGGLLQASLKVGGYFFKNGLQDFSTLGAIAFYTRLFPVRSWKLRQYVKGSFTRLNNRVTYEPLRLNNVYGLPRFRSDSVNGNMRISFYTESVLFLNRKIFGFNFAPILLGGISVMSYEHSPFKKSDGFTAIGAGIRTRNENLIFGTIELKAVYLPRTVDKESRFQLLLTSDLQYRYHSTFIKAPDIIYLNRDDL